MELNLEEFVERRDGEVKRNVETDNGRVREGEVLL
jgi:hypothetical protein